MTVTRSVRILRHPDFNLDLQLEDNLERVVSETCLAVDKELLVRAIRTRIGMGSIYVILIEFRVVNRAIAGSILRMSETDHLLGYYCLSRLGRLLKEILLKLRLEFLRRPYVFHGTSLSKYSVSVSVSGNLILSCDTACCRPITGNITCTAAPQ